MRSIGPAAGFAVIEIVKNVNTYACKKYRKKANWYIQKMRYRPVSIINVL